MWKDPVFILSVLALVVSIGAIVVTTFFYVKSTRDLKSILDYLQMAINNPNIKPHPGQKGIPIIWNAKLRPGGIASQEQVSDNVTVTEVPKKPD